MEKATITILETTTMYVSAAEVACSEYIYHLTVVGFQGLLLMAIDIKSS